MIRLTLCACIMIIICAYNIGVNKLMPATSAPDSSTSGSTIWAEHALIKGEWKTAVAVTIDADGRIINVQPDQPEQGVCTGILLPGAANLHSHAFQRAMAGMTETRGPDPRDSFWSWRKLMYRFLDHLTPDDAESIAAFGQIEMLESGYTCLLYTSPSPRDRG